MLTYQDLLEVGENDAQRTEFVFSAINKHKATPMYYNACVADAYDRQQNETILKYQKLLYTMSGKAVPDNFSANYKLCSNFFHRFVLQQNQFLLGNGVVWEDDSTDDKLGKDFDARLQELGHDALVAGVAFGFWNYDHLEVFNLREFVPLYDEDNGALMAGIRFWQVSPDKPIRAVLYEVDGYTDFIAKKGEKSILHAKRAYKEKVRVSAVDGTEIYDGENYPSFPIVPLFANQHKQSELIGIRESIDAYDLIKSGFANDLDDASQIYWVIQNAGGMDDIDLTKFLERIKTVKAAVVEDEGARAESHTIDVPYAAREAILERIRADLYADYMALDTKDIVGGANTATQIRAAYEPMNNKADMYEYQVLDFLQSLLAIIGIDDNPTFTRSMIVNVQEEINTVIASGAYLPEDYVREKILTILGDGDKVEDIQRQIDADELNASEEEETNNAEEEETTTEPTE